ncbi:hypothetical protein [Phycicoccus sp. CSK15P-2]|uniref:hypothetical protein n=1 Tax=Phycicoccus sp. CSK15P-2 TaxID=2807627 RepID=UPI001EF178E1|nr:hypothetical protein [Phycicoccus sp. CSK15P-2]
MAREQGHVVVDGWGRLADETTSQLRRSGVRVRAGGLAADAAELEAETGGPAPGAVVLVTEGDRPSWVRSPSVAAPWSGRAVPQLPVVGLSGRVVVGPLVVPGTSPCLGCVSGAVPARDDGAAWPSPGAVVLAAAVSTVTVLSVLGGDPSLAGISTEISGRGWTVAHRFWTSRPGCGCRSVRMVG